MSKKTPKPKTYKWDNKSGKNFNDFIEEVEQDKYFKDDEDTISVSSEDLNDTEEADDEDLQHSLLLEELIEQNKFLKRQQHILREELADYEILRISQIRFIKELEEKLLKSNSNLETSYSKNNQ